MPDEILLELTKLFYLIEKWNQHKFDNEELFLGEVKPIISKLSISLEIPKKNDA